MSSVLLGLNRFSNCRTLIAWRDHPVLKAEAGLKSLELDTTRVGDGVRGVRIEGQRLTAGVEVRVVSSDVSTTMLLGDEAILLATQLDEDSLHIKLDLRPLGLNIFDDTQGLHVGPNVVAHNSFTGCEIGIRLA